MSDLEANQTFSAEEAVRVQRELRRSLGLAEEEFPLPAFIGMISDEIEDLRKAGRSETEIAGMIHHLTGKPVRVEDLARFYAPPEARKWQGGEV